MPEHVFHGHLQRHLKIKLLILLLILVYRNLKNIIYSLLNTKTVARTYIWLSLAKH